MKLVYSFFFFQAEDGIRDLTVTGVQTCALPIYQRIAVGSLFLYPDGRIQEAGAILWSNGEAFHYGWGRSPEDRRFTFAREVDYCSGASLLVRKDLFQRLGGFDRRYAPAYYEDADICMGVRSLGYKVVYQPLSRLVQRESATDDTDARTDPQRHRVVNREKFCEKWH